MWIAYALLTIASYAGLDFFLKRMANHINDFFGIMIMSAVAILPALVTLLLFNFPIKKLAVSPNGIGYAALAGICLGIGTLSFLKLFDSGVNLSFASPIVRIGIMVTTITLGMIVLRESVPMKEWLGLGLAVIGMIIIVWK